MNEQNKRDILGDWNRAYRNENDVSGVTFPSEYVIRMFKGTYPDCNLADYAGEGGYEGRSVLDVSCGGVGRNLIVFKQVGFENIAATEISPEIVAAVNEHCESIGIPVDCRVGTNRHLPFEDNSFDFLVSWNACYYFDDVQDFRLHVAEYSRVLKSNGVFVFSIPMRDCFIYKNCIEKKDGLVEITSDPFGVRNGIILRRFENESDIVATFGTHFCDFHFGSINDNCFGLDYKWHIGYSKKVC